MTIWSKQWQLLLRAWPSRKRLVLVSDTLHSKGVWLRVEYGKTDRKTVLQQLEDVIVDHLMAMADAGYALNVSKLHVFVQSYLQESGCNVPQFVNDLPRKDWAYGFLKRH